MVHQRVCFKARVIAAAFVACFAVTLVAYFRDPAGLALGMSFLLLGSMLYFAGYRSGWEVGTADAAKAAEPTAPLHAH